MSQLPKPILGEITAFTIATPDLEQSLAYYQKLGFTEIMRADWPFPWLQVTDGVVLIMLRKDPKPYIALTYYTKNIDKVTAGLEKKGIKFSQKPKTTDMVKRYLFQSPDGVNISLVSIVDGFKQPSGPGMLQMPQEDYFKPEKYVNKTLGLYGEYAHPVAELELSIAFWKLLGFEAVSRFTSPYPWAILSDGLGIVGLHQTTNFTAPTITYFAADMRNKISGLKAAGLTNFKEQNAANIVLTTPEKQHINLFQLGMEAAPVKKKTSDIKQTILETGRLWLKELTPEILNELFTGYDDADIMAFLGYNTQEELETERTNWRKGYSNYKTSLKSFLLVEKASGKIIGKAGFHNWHSQHNRSEMGYKLRDDAYKNKGFMKEALKPIIEYGFKEMRLNRIEAMVATRNEPSLRLMKHFGFTKEGTLRSHYFINGVYEDSVCFGLLRSD